MTDASRGAGSLYRCLICEQIVALKQGARSHVTTAHEGVSDSAAQIERVDDRRGRHRNDATTVDLDTLDAIAEQVHRYARTSSRKFLPSETVANEIHRPQAMVSQAMEHSSVFREWPSGTGSPDRVFVNPYFDGTHARAERSE
jgi:hypothetical protein